MKLVIFLNLQSMTRVILSNLCLRLEPELFMCCISQFLDGSTGLEGSAVAQQRAGPCLQ